MHHATVHVRSKWFTAACDTACTYEKWVFQKAVAIIVDRGGRVIPMSAFVIHDSAAAWTSASCLLVMAQRYLLRI